MLICVLNWTSIKNDKINKISAKISTFLYHVPHHGTTATSGPGPPHYQGFIITYTHTTLEESSEE